MILVLFISTAYKKQNLEAKHISVQNINYFSQHFILIKQILFIAGDNNQ